MATELKERYYAEFPHGTPIVCACEIGRFEDVKLLITGRNNDVNGSNGNNNNMTLKEYVNQEGKRSDGYDCTPLMVATDQAIIDYLFSILLDGITLNTSNATDEYKKLFPKGTPIVCACEKGRFEDVKLLITGYNDVNGSNGNNNNNMTLKEYVNQKGKNRDGYECTLLDTAARNGHFEIVHYLIKHGANAADNTPLVCACEKGRFEDVKLLITGRNDVNGSNGNNNNMTLKEYVNQLGKASDGFFFKYEETPLMAAARNEHFQIVKYLIEQGEADPNIAHSEWGYNALHYAAGNNKKDTKVIELLLTHMSLNSINKKGTDKKNRGGVHSPGLCTS